MKGFFRDGSPVIELFVDGNKINLILDTGFNGYIMLPKKLINQLKLKQIGLSDYMTASGDGKETNVYRAKISFFDEEVEVSVLSTEGNFSLAGMDLFYDCRILIERHNELVEVTKTRVSLGV